MGNRYPEIRPINPSKYNIMPKFSAWIKHKITKSKTIVNAIKVTICEVTCIEDISAA